MPMKPAERAEHELWLRRPDRFPESRELGLRRPDRLASEHMARRSSRGVDGGSGGIQRRVGRVGAVAGGPHDSDEREACAEPPSLTAVRESAEPSRSTRPAREDAAPSRSTRPGLARSSQSVPAWPTSLDGDGLTGSRYDRSLGGESRDEASRPRWSFRRRRTSTSVMHERPAKPVPRTMTRASIPVDVCAALLPRDVPRGGEGITRRGPQSVQSVPLPQVEYSEPAPPSSQKPSLT